MHSHHIKDMTNLICALKRKTPKAVEAALKSYWKIRIAIVWETYDVLAHDIDTDAEITEEEAIGILDDLLRHHDASIGITWGVINDAVSYKLDEKESDWINALDYKDLPLHVNRQWRNDNNRAAFLKRLEGQ